MMPYTVTWRTAVSCYIPNVRRFLEYALQHDLPMGSHDDIDYAICFYFDHLLSRRSCRCAPVRFSGSLERHEVVLRAGG